MAINPIQYLKHGKALCGKVFASFVETFNWHTDFCANLMGDADLPGKAGGTGHITLDRTDPSHPIIRWSSDDGSNGEVPEEEPTPDPDDPPYDPPEEDDDDEDTPEDYDPYDDDYDPEDDQDPWYENPEDSPADPEGGGGAGGGSGCNKWSGDFGPGGNAGGGGWTGDNCGSINNFSR